MKPGYITMTSRQSNSQ